MSGKPQRSVIWDAYPFQQQPTIPLGLRPLTPRGKREPGTFFTVRYHSKRLGPIEHHRYKAMEGDLARLARLYPDSDAVRPPWRTLMQAELVDFGYRRDDLREWTAPEILTELARRRDFREAMDAAADCYWSVSRLQDTLRVYWPPCARARAEQKAGSGLEVETKPLRKALDALQKNAASRFGALAETLERAYTVLSPAVLRAVAEANLMGAFIQIGRREFDSYHAAAVEVVEDVLVIPGHVDDSIDQSNTAIAQKWGGLKEILSKYEDPNRWEFWRIVRDEVIKYPVGDPEDLVRRLREETKAVFGEREERRVSGLPAAVPDPAEVVARSEADAVPKIETEGEQVAEAVGEQPDKSEPVIKGSAVEVLLGADSREILDIARSKKSADDKMREICRIDQRFLGYTSPGWAELLGVSDAAIRKTRFWGHDRQQAIGADWANRGR